MKETGSFLRGIPWRRRIPILLLPPALGLAVWLILRPPGRPFAKHVFLITIDTLRADHLGCYGYARNTSPFIDSLARKGIVFARAISQSASTGPSHASIFTGLYPSQHRLLGNGFMLDDAAVTLAEILQHEGMLTAAFTSTSSHFYCSNLHRGFTFYDEPQNARSTYRMRYRPAAQTIDHAALWLANFDPSRSLFLWVHLFDPHRPYRKHKAIRKELEGTGRGAAFTKYVKGLPINLEVFNGDFRAACESITGYDAEIRYADEELERLFRLVEAKGMREDSLWIITADHGESIGQHDWLDHGKVLYQEDIHVPLILHHGGEKAWGPRRINALVENFAIFPTLLDLLRIVPDEKVRREMQAVSLVPLIRGNPGGPAKPFAFTERTHYVSRASFPPGTPFWKQAWEDGEKFALQDQRWKLIHHSQNGDELYDLERDPLELNNLVSVKPAPPAQALLQGELLRLMGKFGGSRNKPARRVGKKHLRILRSLGYF